MYTERTRLGCDPVLKLDTVNNLGREVTMTMFVRQFAARAVASVIMVALLVGSGVIGYQVLGKGPHPATIITQRPGTGSGPAKVDAEDRAQAEANRVQSSSNLRQLGLAIMAFERANGFLPPAAIRNPYTAQPLLSWRVAVLPWAGSEDSVPAVSSRRSLGQSAQQDAAGEDAGRVRSRRREDE